MTTYEHSQPDALSRILDDKGEDDAPPSRSSSTMELASAVEDALKTPTTMSPPPPSAEEAENADAVQGDTDKEPEADKEAEADKHEEDEPEEDEEDDEPEEEEEEHDEAGEHKADEHEEDEHDEAGEHEEDEHEEDEHEEAGKHDEADEHEADEHEEPDDEPDDEHDETSAALTSLEAQVAALREKADALEQKEEIAEEDMVTLNITLHGMHKELEAACAKMKGTYDKALNRCQLDVTDSLSQVVRKVLTTKPKDKKAEDHQVTFAKHAPAVFYSRPEVCNSPTTVVLRRVFAVPTGSRVRPWSDGGYGYGCGYGRSPMMRSRRRRCARPAASPYYPMPGYGYGYGYAAPPAPAPAPIQMPTMGAYAMPAALQPCAVPSCACGGRKLAKSRSSRRRKTAAASVTPSTLVRQHRRRRGGGRRTGRVQSGGGTAPPPPSACYQHEVCPNQQRFLYDAQGQQGCMQPLAQGGQRFVFPTAVLPVMAPSYYPATGPVSV